MEEGIASGDYQLPPLDLLDEHIPESGVPEEEIAGRVEAIRSILESGKVQVKDIIPVPGPAVTLYKIYPERKVSCSKVRVLMTEIALDLHLKGVRVVPLEDSIGIEIANDRRALVPIRSVLSDDAFRNNKAELPVAIGQTFGNKTVVFDLAMAPHILVTGATKQGKTEAIHAIVASLLYSKRPSELKFVLIDPKGCEFSAYGRIKDSCLAISPEEEPVVKTISQSEKVLASLCQEMERRYELLRTTGTTHIGAYNSGISEVLPYIVTIIDEYADLAIPAGRDKESRNMSHNITESIIRLAQKGKAVGIHIILATQKPSKRVITDTLRANFPTRIAVRTVSKTDSRAILDTPGAESLIGSGDMIFQTGVEAIRLQGACISPEEIDRLTSYVESHSASDIPYYLPDQDSEHEMGRVWHL